MTLKIECHVEGAKGSDSSTPVRHPAFPSPMRLRTFQSGWPSNASFRKREKKNVYDEEIRFVMLICLRHWPGVRPTAALKVRLKEG